jgi:hypothetical protein|tara:strand:+ start:158 stop:352 length:195 start_codon:yes stop_codon:yes gene_type:complete
MIEVFKIGDLVMYEDIREGQILCVILAGGVSGYGNDMRSIYVVYSMKHAGIYLAYDSEIETLKI